MRFLLDRLASRRPTMSVRRHPRLGMSPVSTAVAPPDKLFEKVSEKAREIYECLLPASLLSHPAGPSFSVSPTMKCC
jgi:hypothetical protein